MKKTVLVVISTCAISLAAAISASAQGVGTYSGTALSGLTYLGNLGDAQYVPAAGPIPALAQLSTPDSGTSSNADSPAVFVQGPLGTLSSFSASYSLYGAATGPSGTEPYWIIWLTDDSGFTSPIVADGGPTLNGSSGVHVGDLINGSITLSALDTNIDPRTSLPYGQSTVAWAGVEIGDWDNGVSHERELRFDHRGARTGHDFLIGHGCGRAGVDSQAEVGAGFLNGVNGRPSGPPVCLSRCRC